MLPCFLILRPSTFQPNGEPNGWSTVTTGRGALLSFDSAESAEAWVHRQSPPAEPQRFRIVELISELTTKSSLLVDRVKL